MRSHPTLKRGCAKARSPLYLSSITLISAVQREAVVCVVGCKGQQWEESNCSKNSEANITADRTDSQFSKPPQPGMAETQHRKRQVSATMGSQASLLLGEITWLQASLLSLKYRSSNPSFGLSLSYCACQTDARHSFQRQRYFSLVQGLPAMNCRNANSVMWEID